MNVENLVLILKKNNFEENTEVSENADENITLTRGFYVKCQLCQRTYHKTCIMKRNLHQNYFKCQTCLKVNIYCVLVYLQIWFVTLIKKKK
jgi:hypothetical protein